MAEVVRAALGESAYLFNEQYVVKAAEKGLKFGWHQDSGFVGYPHRPYLSCWCALDEVSVENGTVNLLPYSRAGARELVEHLKDEETSDMVGYFGDDPGEPVVVDAGSIACFSSVCFHRSGATRSSIQFRTGSQGVRFRTARPCSRSAGTETWSCTISQRPSIRRKHAVQRTHRSVI